MENLKKSQLLKGRENYLAWLTRLEIMLCLEGVLMKDKNDKLVVIGIKERNQRQEVPHHQL